MFGHHHSDEAFRVAHAEVDSLYQRLGHDIETLDDAGDPASRQALTDAGERYNTAGAQFAHTTTLGELGVIRSTIVDGLHATRFVRTKQGLDPGPEPTVPAPVAQPGMQPSGAVGGGGLLRGRGGLGTLIGAGAAGGLLGLLGGAALGEVFEGGDGGGWGDGEGGDYDGGGDFGGGDFGGD